LKQREQKERAIESESWGGIEESIKDCLALEIDIVTAEKH
jgi:hypothetical protein